MSLFRQPSQTNPDHLYVIDLTRGLAALAVLLWHYKQFYYLVPGVQMLTPTVNVTQPGYAGLWLLYDYGHYAVQFFWMLSGFVFAAVYVGRGVKTRSFVVNRFARLYPLHLLTLFVIAALQIASLRATGRYQIIPINDAYHFILNLFFASFWGIQKGYSFNGPIWSVSVEVLVYGLFWATLPFLFRKGAAGPIAMAALAWVAAFMFEGHLHLLRECVFYFFTGAVIYLGFTRWRHRPATFFVAGAGLLVAGIAALWLPTKTPDAIAVPLLLVSAVLLTCGCESLSWGKYAELVQWIGDSTYGIYLWHLPFQVAALIVFSLVPGTRAAITQPWFLIFFLVTVMAIARLSYVYVEKPARKALRRFADPKPPERRAEEIAKLDELAAP